MPSPSTVDEFLDLLRKSGVADDKRIETHLEKLRDEKTLPTEPGKLAGVLVRDGLLTKFQAEQLMQGKWRRFTIGKYKVLEPLGQGGMGAVYLCEHKLMRRRVAVKVLPKAKADDPASLERFHREARVVAALDHPNIVRAYDIDQDADLHFLVMEHVDGASLQEIIKRAGPMDVLRACHYMLQSALGLHHAHESAAIVHRDIKPGNILVDRNGVVKILDMGLARFFNDEEDALTKKYDETVLGTADYLAPEQALDSHGVDIRADIYSLGGTFYFCLTGRTPFAEGTVAQKLIWHQTRQPKPVSSLRADVPEGVAALIEKMMAKRPEDRFQTPQELAAALAPWTRTPIGPPPESEMPRLSPASMAPTVAGEGASTGPDGSGPKPAAKTWEIPAKTPPSVRPVRPAAPKRPATPRPAAPPPAQRPGVPPPSAPTALRNSTPPPKPAPTPPRPAGSLLQATPVVPKPAAPQPNAAPAEEAPWEQIAAADTDELAAKGDTGRASARGARRRGVVDQTTEAIRNRRRLYAIMGAGLAALFILLLVLWLVLGNNSNDNGRPNEPPYQGVTRHVGPGEEFKTVASAVYWSQPKDTIVVRADVVQEYLALDGQKLRDIRIEAEANRTVVWKAPANPPKDPPPLVGMSDFKGLHLKGFVFDGGNKVRDLLVLSCACRNITLEDLTLKNFTRAGICFTNCEATAAAPVVLTNVRASGPQPPLWFEVLSEFPMHPANAHIEVRDDCAFTGNSKIKMLGATTGVKLPAALAPRVDKTKPK